MGGNSSSHFSEEEEGGGITFVKGIRVSVSESSLHTVRRRRRALCLPPACFMS